MRLSISAKIFVGFLVVLATSGGVNMYGAFTMRRLGDELRLVSRGYLGLQLQIRELQAGHSNLLKVLVETASKAEVAQPIPRFIKFAIDDARRTRLKQQLPVALSDVRSLAALRASAEEHQLLSAIRLRLEKIDHLFHADEELFDIAYGAIGDAAPATLDPLRARPAAERLLRNEKEVRAHLSNLAYDLKNRSQQAGLRLEEEQNRAVWATFGLAAVVIAVGLLVMVVATRTLRPLERLADGAKEIARGHYKERVDASTPDEIGALGREFNAMAAALDEREQRLIRSERLAAVGKIAAQITHEVRNPLSSIGLNAELLEEELAGLTGPPSRLEEAKALTRAIVKEVDRLTEITEEYLRFARLPRPRLEREELQAIIASLLSFLRGELESRAITVEADLDAARRLVAADEHQLRQALLNLLRNAAEAMPQGGRLRVIAALGEGAVEILIGDTGEGIAPEHLGKVFDPFFSTKDGGTGLGLALTQQIILEHGGAIEVKSAIGEGTTFTVRLPTLSEDIDPRVAAE